MTAQFILGFADYAAAHPEVGQPLTSQYTERPYTSDDDQKVYVITTQWTTAGRLYYFSESNEICFKPRGSATPQPAALVQAIDVSSNQPADISHLIAKANAKLVLVHLYHFVEAPQHQITAKAQIDSTRTNGASVGGYSWIFNGYSPAGQVSGSISLARSKGVTLPALFLDIEEYPDDKSIPTADEVIAAVQACRDESTQPGIYTRRDIWERIGNPQLPGVWLWDANWNGDQTLNMTPYGSMTLVGHQFSNKAPDGTPLDCSVFSPVAAGG